MLIHYLKIAWRNLIKYKTQNIISILSIAVGTVCFAITLQAMKSVVADIYFQEIDRGTASVNVYKMTEEQYKNRKTLDDNFADIQHAGEETLDANFVKRLYSQHLPSMREVLFMSYQMKCDVRYEAENGNKKTLQTYIARCSPRHFHYYRYYSAITSERIPELRQGDILISDDVRDKIYGKGADPRGCIVYNPQNGNPQTIRDVVKTSERLGDMYMGTVFYVDSLPSPNFRFYRLSIELARGTTPQQLQKELTRAMPEYYFTYTINDFDWSDEGILFVTFITAILFLGCSVLLIAITGYFKMQVQLFSLRSRELALRRTMGAHPRQLVTLLIMEIIIIFISATVISFCITAFLADYALPIMSNIHQKLAINIDAIYNLQIWIILITLSITMLAATIIVYKQLRVPVGMRIGRSGHPRTVGQSLILSVQLAVSMILILAMLGLFYLIYDTVIQQSDRLPDNLSPYRRALILDKGLMDGKIPDFYNRLIQTEEIEHISNLFDVSCKSTIVDTNLVPRTIEYKDENGTVTEHNYFFTISDEEIFDRLDIEITPFSPTDEQQMARITAVYVPTEDVKRLRDKWKLSPTSDIRTTNIYNNRSYTLIGYTKPLPYYHSHSRRNYAPVLWIVDNKANPMNTNLSGGITTFHIKPQYIIFPKKGKTEKGKESIIALYKEAQPFDMNDILINSLYEAWFDTMKLMEMFSNLGFLLVFVSILCIVSSLYSNISLESRAREKEVALRKIHGAKRRDIMHLFGKYYIRLLLIAATFVFIVEAAMVAILNQYSFDFESEHWTFTIISFLLSTFIVTFVTLATIGHKIYKISRIKAADIIKKE